MAAVLRRLLSPSRNEPPTLPKLDRRGSWRHETDHPPPKRDEPFLSIHVPRYGTIFLSPLSQDPYVNPNASASDPKEDYLFTGELEVRMPPGPPRRCKRITIRYLGELAYGPGGFLASYDRYAWPENDANILFERKVDLEDEGGIWLEEGSQRFEFTFIIPYNVPKHDVHPQMAYIYSIYASVEGLPAHRDTPISRPRAVTETGEHLSDSPDGRSVFYGSVGSRVLFDDTGKPIPSDLPATPHYPTIYVNGRSSTSSTSAQNPTLADASSTSRLPAVPTYEESEVASSDSDWIKGQYRTKRRSGILHNPNPDGRVNQFIDQMNEFTAGLGITEMRTHVEQWTVGCVFPFRLRLPTLSPLVTLFCFRVRIQQKRKLMAHRDFPGMNTEITFPILQQGERPPIGHTYPSKSASALWRGTDCGGKDLEAYEWGGQGRLPPSTTSVFPLDTLRASTLPGMEEPIVTNHKLIYDIYFSVYGEDENGNRMRRPGPGGLRVMRRTLDVLLPSCLVYSRAVDLPAYDMSVAGHRPLASDVLKDANTPCSKCGTRPIDRVCTDCPPTQIPHLRHDLGKRGDSCDECCGRSLLPPGEFGGVDCACKHENDDLDFFALGKGFDLHDGGVELVDPEKQKREAERGRQT